MIFNIRHRMRVHIERIHMYRVHMLLAKRRSIAASHLKRATGYQHHVFRVRASAIFIQAPSLSGKHMNNTAPNSVLLNYGELEK